VTYIEVRGEKIIVSFQSAPVDYLFSRYQVDLVRVPGLSVYNDVADRLFVNTTDYVSMIECAWQKYYFPHSIVYDVAAPFKSGKNSVLFMMV